MRLYSFLNTSTPSVQSDLGWLAVRCARAMHNAGQPLHWLPLAEASPAQTFSRAGAPLRLNAPALAHAAQHDVRLRDIPVLATPPAHAHDDGIALAMTHPIWWAMLLASAKRRIAYLDNLHHWPLPWLVNCCQVLSELWVPTEAMASTLRQSLPQLPIHVLPAPRQHHLVTDVSTAQLASMRELLNISPTAHVFYAMLDAHAALDCVPIFEAYARAFQTQPTGDVAFVIQCPPQVRSPDPANAAELVPAHATISAVLEQLSHALGYQPPNVVCLAENINAQGELMLHMVANTLIAPAHGDGLMLRSMDAVGLGNTVIAPSGRGFEAWLGEAWSGIHTPLNGAGYAQALQPRLLQVLQSTRAPTPEDKHAQQQMLWHMTNSTSAAQFSARVAHLLQSARAP